MRFQKRTLRLLAADACVRWRTRPHVLALAVANTKETPLRGATIMSNWWQRWAEKKRARTYGIDTGLGFCPACKSRDVQIRTKRTPL